MQPAAKKGTAVPGERSIFKLAELHFAFIFQLLQIIILMGIKGLILDFIPCHVR